MLVAFGDKSSGDQRIPPFIIRQGQNAIGPYLKTEIALLHFRRTEGYNLDIKGIAKVPMKDCSVEPPDCLTDRPPISVEKVAVAKLPTKRGDFMIAGYRSLISDEEFV